MPQRQDEYMPLANILRIMRRVLPANAKITDDAKESIQKCVSELISIVTVEANESCQREHRRTVTAEDLLSAMGRLGFDNYVDTLTLYLEKYRKSEGLDLPAPHGDATSLPNPTANRRPNRNLQVQQDPKGNLQVQQGRNGSLQVQQGRNGNFQGQQGEGGNNVNLQLVLYDAEAAAASGLLDGSFGDPLALRLGSGQASGSGGAQL
uniref:Putative transcription factor H2A superfamily protein n=1 Tax=Linum usitatissimum TaxID=4006 RepID=F6LC72_LINUS|nr:putative transcription factor H2A superfamily protein [Linum usitatissimum]